MRLTLRTLLAYLDDTLEPARAKEIGQRLKESEGARDLADRIKKVLRRRSLGVPPDSGPERVDANTVAEYLSDTLPAERVSDLEEKALHSEVHLAEIAACHQILALVVGEPAKVPPTARQRMYGLVKGRESIPQRKAAVLAPVTVDIADDPASGTHDQRILPRAQSRWRWWIVGGLAAGVVGTLWVALPSGPTPRERPTTPLGTEVAEATKPPTPAVQPEVKTPTPTVQPVIKPPTDTPVEPTTPMPPAIAPPPVAPVDRTPNNAPQPAAKLANGEHLLLQSPKPGDPLVMVPATAQLLGGATLLALPGARPELSTDRGLLVTLWGGLPDLNPGPTLDSRATLHVPAAGVDADLTLDTGRVVLGTIKPNGIARVRAGGQVWDITLSAPGTEAVVEATATTVAFGVLAGSARLAADGSPPQTLTPGTPVPVWQVAGGRFADRPADAAAYAPQWSRQPAPNAEKGRAAELKAALGKLQQALGQPGKTVDLALAELPRTDRGAALLHVYANAAVGNLSAVLDALDDPAKRELREAAAATLQSWLPRSPANKATLQGVLLNDKNYNTSEAVQAMELLAPLADADATKPQTYDRLIDGLKANRLAVRELAITQLAKLDPDGQGRVKFDPAAPPDQRERAVKNWRTRIPEGGLPPHRR